MQAITITNGETQRDFADRMKARNDGLFERTGRRRTAFVRTYGCQQNVSDSERIKGLLEAMGYGEAEGPEEADLVIFNTCAVREHAELRVYGNVGALKPIKERRPDMVIALCGCMMQQKVAAEKIKKTYPYVDIVFGTGMIHRLPGMLLRVTSGEGRVFDTDCEDTVEEGLPVKRGDGVKAWLPISYGCNNFCTYCIVPYVRGRERSRRPEDVLREANGLVAAGYKDITLLGQNVNSYGNDLGNYDFPRLLRDIDAIPGDFRIRFMTSHPKDATDALIDAVASCGKVSKHIHLPVQSGSDRILKLMNRRYTREDYLALVGRAKAAIPGLSLTSDIIVGFPGETREDFLSTLDLVKRVEFDSLFMFIYSKRTGTPAAEMDDPVQHEEKVARLNELLEVQDLITERHMRAYVGKTVRVLCEGPGKTGEGWMTGRTDSGTIVDFHGGNEVAGRFIDIEITDASRLLLKGRADGGASGAD